MKSREVFFKEKVAQNVLLGEPQDHPVGKILAINAAVDASLTQRRLSRAVTFFSRPAAVSMEASPHMTLSFAGGLGQLGVGLAKLLR